MIKSNNILKKLIKKRLKTLITEITKLDTSGSENGLFSGAAGLSLFYFYASRYYKDESLYNMGYELLENCISDCSSDLLAYCDGLAGINWTLAHLKKYDFIDIDLDYVILESDELLYKSLDCDFKVNNIDFLYGMVGKAIYFTERLSKDSIEYTSKIIDHLYLTANRSTPNCFFWDSYSHQIDRYIQDLGLSHGISSIIMLTLKTCLLNINRKKSEEIAKKAINFLISNSEEGYISKFPSLVDHSNEFIESRLAWCYGDLGIALTMYRAGVTFNNRSYIDFSSRILTHSMRRRNGKTTRLNDILICHGTTGVFLMFHRLYYETKNFELLLTSEFWLRQSLSLASPIYQQQSNRNWTPYKDIGILTGASGVGLAYLMYLNDGALDWDSALLLQ